MYTINIHNQSTMDTTFVIFQQPPVDDFRLYSLAWQTARIRSNSNYSFSWEKDYSFIATTPGNLRTGTVVNTINSMPARLQGGNRVTLDNSMYFSNLQTGSIGVFTVQVDGGVPPLQCAVGIGMSNSGLFIAPVLPNNSISIPEPQGEYYVAYGNIRQGEVIEYQQLMSNAAKVNFSGPGIANVTLESNGMFTVLK